MTVRDTSIEAYREIQSVTGRQQARILRALASRPNSTRRELAMLTGIDTASVAGRVNELVKTGRIAEGAQRPCSISGRLAYTLRISTPGIESDAA